MGPTRHPRSDHVEPVRDTTTGRRPPTDSGAARAARVHGMPSVARSSWTTSRAKRLNQLAEAHRLLRENGPRNSNPLEALNWSMVLVLASEFQGFARELHDEAAEFLASSMARGDLRYFEIARNNLTAKRELDSVNAKPSSINTDFKRLGISDLWAEIERSNPAGAHWRAQLGTLNAARNAIAHNNPDKLQVLGVPINAKTIRSWRGYCNKVSWKMDVLVQNYLLTTTGIRPW
jgi:hypothetical protein